MRSDRTLAQVRNELKVPWYRSRVEPQVLRSLTQRSNLKGAVQTLGHFLLFLATGSLVFLFWRRQIWIGFAIALFFHGTVAGFLNGSAPHELAHGTVFRTKWLNSFFLYLFSIIGWWDSYDYAMSHTYHHRYTLYPEGDQENVLPLVPSLAPFLLLQMFTFHAFGGFGRNFGKGGFLSNVVFTARRAFRIKDRSANVIRVWLRELHDDQPQEARKSVRWARAQLLFHAAVVAFGIVSGYWVIILLLTTASYTARAATYFVDLPQHCGLRDNTADFRKCVRSMKLGPLLGFLYWHMQWHTEHHMYAAVPCYNLKKLANVISDDMPEPRTLVGAWKEMRAIWKTQRSDPSFQFDTPLPTTATPEIGVSDPNSHESNEKLAGSIGDLAPTGLS